MLHDNEYQAILRCKPGDRAIISRCGNTAYIGLLVRVISRHQTPDFDWIVEFLGAPVAGHELYTRLPGTFAFAPVFDWNLTRLPGLESEYPQTEADPARANVQMF
ncbi:hypothetical protein [Burkholderia cenocepacia]|uniref:hypothetical protein n=1 Tax=Burkholderia cenocepacia TaxID=95486 RepID=UPI0018A830E9|nr:hypothetical protein [Burkholderia cenocepacia]